MPIEIGRENPTTGTGVYFPASSGCVFSFHGVNGRPDRSSLKYAYHLHEIAATEAAFREVWRQGVLLSSLERDRLGGGHSSMIFATDVVACDDQYVFLTVAEPHSIGHHGYHFVFDPYVLVEEGALIGLTDLGTMFYGSLSEQLGVENRNDLWTWTQGQIEAFQRLIEPVQKAWRVSGRKAVEWLRWVQGDRARNPVTAKTLRANAIGIRVGEHNIEYIVKDRTSARRAELLVPFELDLRTSRALKGVIFRKNWIPIGEFVEAYGLPGTEPPPAIDPVEANMLPSTGNPAICSRCHGWMYLRPLEIPDRSPVWSVVWKDDMQKAGADRVQRLMVCGSCRAAFASPEKGMAVGHDPFVAEEYVGQYDEFKYVRRGW
jgi:hypothetical protein